MFKGLKSHFIVFGAFLFVILVHSITPYEVLSFIALFNPYMFIFGVIFAVIPGFIIAVRAKTTTILWSYIFISSLLILVFMLLFLPDDMGGKLFLSSFPALVLVAHVVHFLKVILTRYKSSQIK